MAERIKRITVKPFMDVNTMIEERLTQCCVHVGTRGDDEFDQCAPFCAVQAWPALSEQKLARRVAVRELQAASAESLAAKSLAAGETGAAWALPMIEEGVS
jgi:uncharacterized radical SAM superfamily Fe-S cluster-containing enzyme